MMYDDILFDTYDEDNEDLFEKDRSRAKRRKKNASKAKRKMRLAQKIYGKGNWHYKSLHQYSKNKIHCSCQMCRFRSDWNPKQKTLSDMRKDEHAAFLLKEFNCFGLEEDIA